MKLSIDPETGVVVPLHHPRRFAWRESFSLAADGTITGLTAAGRATVQLLESNGGERTRLRALLLRRGRYP